MTLRILAILLLITLLPSCAIRASTLAGLVEAATIVESEPRLTVRNYCGGADSVVRLYINGVYRGTVSDIATFFTPRGTINVRAEGRLGNVYSVSYSLGYGQSQVWNLCG